MRGLVRMARAMATRCFWPPLRRIPRSPTLVLYPCGNALMKSCAFASFAASSTCPHEQRQRFCLTQVSSTRGMEEKTHCQNIMVLEPYGSLLNLKLRVN